jgi:glycine betaine/choline ABC-type transport system substrate-binding protein
MTASPPRRRDLLPLAAGLFSIGCRREKPLIVASKANPEGVLLGEIAALLLERKTGKVVERHLGMGDSAILFQALQSGDVHVYPEYSAVCYKALLGVAPPANLRELFAARANASWLDPLGFEASYVLLVRASDERYRGNVTITEACANQTDFKLGCEPAFASSPEGYALLRSAYEVQEQTAPRIEANGSLYRALAGEVIDVMVTTSTDPAAHLPDYRILHDDRKIFAGNRPSLLLNGALAQEVPAFPQAMRSLCGRIDNETILRLNTAVLRHKRPVAEVALEFLTNSGLV